MIKSVVLVFTLLFLAPSAFGAEPLYFLWDVGSERDKADTGDVVENVGEACNSPKLLVNWPKLLTADPMPEITVTPEKTQALIESFPLPKLDDKFYRMVWVMDSFKGEGDTVFILLPEAHKTPNQESTLRHHVLHFTRAYFSVGLIEELLKSSTSILNVREGIVGRPSKPANLRITEKNNLDKVSEMAEQGYSSAFSNISNIYDDSEKIFSAYLEKPDLINADALLTLGSFDGKKSFEEVFAEAQKAFDYTLDEKSMHETFNKLQGMAPQGLQMLAHMVCQMRGHEMVDSALTLVKQKKAKVVFLAYGALHHFEIAEKLRQNKMSYITLLGRLPKDMQ